MTAPLLSGNRLLRPFLAFPLGLAEIGKHPAFLECIQRRHIRPGFWNGIRKDHSIPFVDAADPLAEVMYASRLGLCDFGVGVLDY